MAIFKKKSPKNENVDKKNKKKKDNINRKEYEKSEIAIKHGIRISNPYGYFPEDVDRIIKDMESQLSNLSKENKTLSDNLSTTIKERDAASSELRTLLMQVSAMEIPDTSTETEFHMISRLKQIEPDVGDLPEEVLDESKFVGVVEPILEDRIEVEEQIEQQETFDNLVSISKKPKKEEKLKEEKHLEKQRQRKSTFDLEILGGEEE